MAFIAQEQLTTIPVVVRQSALMTQRFHDWPAAHLSRRTYCKGWTAGDIVAHLATGAEFYTEVISAGLKGRPGLPWQAVTIDEVRDIRAAAVSRLQRGGPSALIDGFEQAAGNLQDVFASLQVNDLASMAWHPRGLIPIGCWIGMRLTELVVHDWDILQPHNPGLPLSPVAAPAVLMSLPEMQQRFLEQRLPEDTCDGIHVLHAGDQSWSFVRHGRGISYQRTIPEHVDTHLYTDAETMILLTLGRTDFKRQLQDGVCALAGDVALARIFYAFLFTPYLSSSATPPRAS